MSERTTDDEEGDDEEDQSGYESSSEADEPVNGKLQKGVFQTTDQTVIRHLSPEVLLPKLIDSRERGERVRETLYDVFSALFELNALSRTHLENDQ